MMFFSLSKDSIGALFDVSINPHSTQSGRFWALLTLV